MKTNPMTFTLTALVLASFMFVHCSTIQGAPDMTLQDKDCNVATYTAGDSYADTVDYMLQDLLTTTANSPGMDRRTHYQSTDGSIIYGHGSCSTYLTAPDCVTCIQSAYSTVVQHCDGKVGGRVFLTDCSIRYENYYFDDK